MEYFNETWDISMNTLLTQVGENEPINASFFKDSFNLTSNEEKSADTFFGLTNTVKLLIQKYKGITDLYDWQKSCLQLNAVQNRSNLVYSLPTSGGKTLVAEILMFKELLIQKKNAIFVLPYVALAQEKVRSLSPFALDLGFYVEEYVGGKGIYPPVKHRNKRSVYVCTIEKASGLIESLIQNKRLNDEIGMMVVDEIHLIGDRSRGIILESLLTKLMYTANDVQIIAMSATIGNLDEIAKFLKAEIYTHDFRPVELTEFVKCENDLYKVVRYGNDYSELKLERQINEKYGNEVQKLDSNGLGFLVQEVIPNESCLVFCSTKKGCCNFSLLICKTLSDSKNIKEFKKTEKLALLRALEEEGQGNVCHILKKTIPYGVAYHHSGLTNAERKLLEEAFISGTICCICCTSTLAAGVNLPAKRVIIFSPFVGKDFLKLSSYKQMSGRAGRMGFTDAGQSILICQKTEMPKVAELLESTMDFCESALYNKEGIARLIISAIGLEMSKTLDELNELLSRSLMYVQASARNCDSINIKEQLENCLTELEEINAVKKNPEIAEYSLTSLASAAMAGNLSITEAKMLMQDLEEAVTKGLILRNNLHLFYLITPYSMLDEIKIDQNAAASLFSNLSEDEKRVAFRLGITEASLCQFLMMGTIKSVPERVWRRFLLSLIIFNLWNSNSIWKVSKMFEVSRGEIHSFLMRAAAFASSVQRFTEALKMEQFECFPPLLQRIIPRIAHCCTVELLQLMQLPAVKIGRAQQLYKAGFKTLSDIANVNPLSLVTQIDHLPRKVAYEIVAAAKLLILQKAETLQEEAELIKADLNVTPKLEVKTSTPLATQQMEKSKRSDISLLLPSQMKKKKF